MSAEVYESLVVVVGEHGEANYWEIIMVRGIYLGDGYCVMCVCSRLVECSTGGAHIVSGSRVFEHDASWSSETTCVTTMYEIEN